MGIKTILAQAGTNLGDSVLDGIDQGTTIADLPTFITGLLNTLIGAAAVVCVAVMIFSGYMYITASGDEAKVEKATKTLTFAIVGLAICFIAVLLVNFVLTEILGVKK